MEEISRLAALPRILESVALDLLDLLRGRTGLPPHRLRHVGRGDFHERGEWAARLLLKHGLRPDDRVLDIGCGIGRVALALTRVLSPSATYDGFDIDARAIDWCRSHVTQHHPNFRFTHADVFNSRYRRAGSSPAAYRFPFDDASFDFAYATSVFTHLESEAAANYFAEAGRVLRPGGTLVATCFVLAGSPNDRLFPPDAAGRHLRDAADPGRGAAQTEGELREMLPAGLWSEVTVLAGAWRTGEFSFSILGQDVVVAKRGATSTQQEREPARPS